jgi:hypothetical protein
MISTKSKLLRKVILQTVGIKLSLRRNIHVVFLGKTYFGVNAFASRLESSYVPEGREGRALHILNICSTLNDREASGHQSQGKFSNGL